MLVSTQFNTGTVTHRTPFVKKSMEKLYDVRVIFDPDYPQKQPKHDLLKTPVKPLLY